MGDNDRMTWWRVVADVPVSTPSSRLQITWEGTAHTQDHAMQKMADDADGAGLRLDIAWHEIRVTPLGKAEPAQDDDRDHCTLALEQARDIYGEGS